MAFFTNSRLTGHRVKSQFNRFGGSDLDAVDYSSAMLAEFEDLAPKLDGGSAKPEIERDVISTRKNLDRGIAVFESVSFGVQ